MRDTILSESRLIQMPHPAREAIPTETEKTVIPQQTPHDIPLAPPSIRLFLSLPAIRFSILPFCTNPPSNWPKDNRFNYRTITR
jgi:hypothetical protein